MLLFISYVILLLVDGTKTETDLALDKPASSSSHIIHPPQAVNDGNTGTTWGSNSCFAVQLADYDPWWQMDLQVKVKVTKVKVTARSECCPERLHDFSIDVYQEQPSNSAPKVCYFYSGSVSNPGETVTVTCSRPVTGRFVRISGKNKLNPEDVLQMCDVQVFGVAISTHFDSCASLVQYKQQHSTKTPLKTISEGIDNTAACAAACERSESCTGFSIRHLPATVCELLQGEISPSLQADVTWDSYVYQGCFSVCE
ncbi:fucolectin-4-like isoform X2 [Haliotis rubra]|uniref:fucolectin-4-like isoform X2 n=1 Tax=Haliotis rubra TaxID=36100 RepID=UPI001EE55A4B|nr:fucolectin-4-like isoform X2 [Haliotis rubra]